MIFIIPMWLENHTLVRDILHSQSMNFSPIHPFNISYSSFKFWVPFTEFHTYLVLFHRPLIHPFLNEFHDVMEWKSYPRDPFTPQNPSILCQKFIPCKQIKNTPWNPSILCQKFIPHKQIKNIPWNHPFFIRNSYPGNR